METIEEIHSYANDSFITYHRHTSNHLKEAIEYDSLKNDLMPIF